jgi:hypothetical protein
MLSSRPRDDAGPGPRAAVRNRPPPPKNLGPQQPALAGRSAAARPASAAAADVPPGPLEPAPACRQPVPLV